MVDGPDVLDEFIAKFAARNRLSDNQKLFLTVLRGSSPWDAEHVAGPNGQELTRSMAPILGRDLGLSNLEADGRLALVRDEAGGEGSRDE